MIRKLLSSLRTKNCSEKALPSSLPEGLEAALPVENAKLQELLEGPDITASGGMNLVVNGRPVGRPQAVQNP